MPYPPIEPYRWDYLDRPCGHSLYFEEAGNPHGLPIVVLHGGPGSGARPMHRRWCDPHAYRIVLWDQRAAGRSRAKAALRRNDTAHLISDLEALRTHLGIVSWGVLGGSWGGTLALRYAAMHPERVHCLVVRGTLAGRRIDREWFFGRLGVARLLPRGYHSFLEALPERLRGDPLYGYYTVLTDTEAPSRRSAATAWLAWEDCVSSRGQNHTAQPSAANDRALQRAQVACHYAVNGFFLSPEIGALPPYGALDGIPGTIIHGAQDLVCPVDQAYAIHERWCEAHLQIVTQAGHLDSEPGIADALVAATNRFRGSGS